MAIPEQDLANLEGFRKRGSDWKTLTEQFKAKDPVADFTLIALRTHGSADEKAKAIEIRAKYTAYDPGRAALEAQEEKERENLRIASERLQGGYGKQLSAPYNKPNPIDAAGNRLAGLLYQGSGAKSVVEGAAATIHASVDVGTDISRGQWESALTKGKNFYITAQTGIVDAALTMTLIVPLVTGSTSNLTDAITKFLKIPENEAKRGAQAGEGTFVLLTFVLPVSKAGTAGRVTRAEMEEARLVRTRIVQEAADTAAEGVVRAARTELQIVADVVRNKCFAAGTPLLTPDGEKFIEEFRPGDRILSRDENDLYGSVQARVVDEVFVRTAPIIGMQIGARLIRTTAEHPFYLRNKGWVAAAILNPGDCLASHDGQWVTVEAITDLKQVATVYNLRVSDYHTYFVGSREWGFSVWAHNANYVVEHVGGGWYKVKNTSTNQFVQGSIDSAGNYVAGGGRDLVLSGSGGTQTTLATLARDWTAQSRGTPTGATTGLTTAEQRMVEDLLSQGRNVQVIPRGADRTADFLINNVQTELKTLSGVANQTSDGLSAAMASRIMDGRGQASHILVDVSHQAGMTREIAERGIVRAFGADNATGRRIQSIQVVGNGFDFTVPRIN